MQVFHSMVLRVGRTMDVVGGTVLTLMMLMTVLDVVLRFFKIPITGTYELVFLGGAVVIGCAIPVTSWEGGHVNVDVLVDRLPEAAKKGLALFNRVLGIIFFALLGVNLFLLGSDLYASGEVSLTLHVPYYPVAYILSLCAFVEALVLASKFIKTISGGEHE